MRAQFSKDMEFCNADLNFFNEENQNYGFNWTKFNESFVPAHGTNQLYKAFQYKDSSILQGYPYPGKYNTYMGGGYTYEFVGKLSYIKGNLSTLQQLGWIDRQTRAIFIEFSVYNPNINIIMVSTILFEFLPTGHILASARFDPLSLFKDVSQFVTPKIICDIVYMLFIVMFMITELRNLYKIGFKLYIKQFWNWIEWIIIAVSWTAFAIFFYKLYAAYDVMDFFKKTSGYGYIKLQRINEWNQVLCSCLAVCCFFGTLKFFKLLRFNMRVYSMATTLCNCAKELAGFGVVFVLVWMSFVQLFYLFFNETVSSYASIVKSMETSFQIMLGKFEVTSLLNANAFFGPILFIFYNLMVVILLLNMFVSIICDSFASVSKTINTTSNEIELVDYIKERVSTMIGLKTKKVHNIGNLHANEGYVDNVRYLSRRMEKFLIEYQKYMIKSIEEEQQNERILNDIKVEFEDENKEQNERSPVESSK